MTRVRFLDHVMGVLQNDGTSRTYNKGHVVELTEHEWEQLHWRRDGQLNPWITVTDDELTAQGQLERTESECWCRYCGRGFSQIAAKATHQQQCERQWQNKRWCEKCGQSFKDRRGYVSHEKSCTGPETTKKQRQAAFGRDNGRKKHEYGCNFCSFTGPSASSVRWHKERDHPIALARERREKNAKR